MKQKQSVTVVAMENSVEFDDIKFKCVCLCCIPSTDEQDNKKISKKHLCCIRTSSCDEKDDNASFKKHLLQSCAPCWFRKRKSIVQKRQKNNSSNNQTTSS